MQFGTETADHCNGPTAQDEARTERKSRWNRQHSILAVLAILVGVGQFVTPPTSEVGSGTTTPEVWALSGVEFDRTRVIHRADALQEVLLWLEDILAALKGRKRPEPDPDNPNPEIVDPDPEKGPEEVTDEEIDGINEAADEAEDEGVNVGEERVDNSWEFEEVKEFVGLLIDLIEEFQQSSE